MISKIVAQKKDGTMIKGLTGNFLPYRTFLHITTDQASSKAVEIDIDDLKAIFFVKMLYSAEHATKKTETDIIPERYTGGRQIKVTFRDNEIIFGHSHSFHIDRLGFFMTPNDPSDNNERIFVVLSSIKELVVDGKSIDIPEEISAEKRCNACGHVMNLTWKFCPYDGTKIKD